jgi:hypothetical protein
MNPELGPGTVQTRDKEMSGVSLWRHLRLHHAGHWLRWNLRRAARLIETMFDDV